MRVEDIEYAIMVGKAGTIGRAAEQLGMSQPALSKALLRLETELDTKLFERSSRGVQLSEEGRVFLEHGQRAAQDAADARTALRDLRQGVSGVVRLGLGAGIPSKLVTDTCADAVNRGAVRFVISAGMNTTLVSALRGGELDLVISDIPPMADRELQWAPMWPDPMVPLLPRSHPAARKRSKWSLEQLREQAWILPPRGTVARESFESAFVANGLTPPDPIVESRAHGREGELAAALNALELLPLSLMSDARFASQFQIVRSVPSLRFERMISLVSRRAEDTSPVVAGFLSRLLAVRARWTDANSSRTGGAAVPCG